jgi:hypothetical protein
MSERTELLCVKIQLRGHLLVLVISKKRVKAAGLTSVETYVTVERLDLPPSRQGRSIAGYASTYSSPRHP